jgi:hypothetical protein
VPVLFAAGSPLPAGRRSRQKKGVLAGVSVP